MRRIYPHDELDNSPVPFWTGPDRVRIARLIAHLHSLGERPLLEFFEELAADPVVRLDLEILLPRYARLDPGMVAALGGRELRLPIFGVEDPVGDDVDDADDVDRRAVA